MICRTTQQKHMPEVDHSGVVLSKPTQSLKPKQNSGKKLYDSTGRDLRRALFSLKQIFQDDKDLVHEFVMAEGLTCLIKVGAEADQNYQNYILRGLIGPLQTLCDVVYCNIDRNLCVTPETLQLRVNQRLHACLTEPLGQIMLYVDGMNGLIRHNETVEWLYTLVGSKFRLVVKTALKLLLVFVEYTESNAPLLIQAVNTVDSKKGSKPWSNAMEILSEKDGMDTELLVYAMTLINKTLAGLPDQDSFYDVVDSLEEQGIETLAQRQINRKGADLDLVEQFNIYEATLRHEDGDDEAQPPSSGHKSRRRASVGATPERRGLERRRSRRHSLQNGKGHTSAPTSPCHSHTPNILPFNGQRIENISEREEEEEEDEELQKTEHSRQASESWMASTVEEASSLCLPFKCMVNFIPNTADTDSEENLRGKSGIQVICKAPVSSPPQTPDFGPLISARLSSWASVSNGYSGTYPGRSAGVSSAPSTPYNRFGLTGGPPADSKADRPALGGLLTSSYRQHQESLNAERERRRLEREERLQRIEREERNRFNRDYVDKREDIRQAREERYKQLERVSADEKERERAKSTPRGRTEITLSLSSRTSSSSLPRSAAPLTVESREDTCSVPHPTQGAESESSRPVQTPVTLTASEPPSASTPAEPEEEQSPLELENITLSLSQTSTEAETCEKEETTEGAEEHEMINVQEEEKKDEEPEENCEDEASSTGAEECERRQMLEDNAILSEKERQNEELNEKDNCSASSISSASSTLEREEREEKLGNESGQWTDCVNTGDVTDERAKDLNNKCFMLDMLYSQSKKPAEEEEREQENEKEHSGQDSSVSSLAIRISTLEARRQACEENVKKMEKEHLDNQGSVRAVAEKFGDLVKGLALSHEMEHLGKEKQQMQEKSPPAPSPTPPKKESDHIWDQLMASPRELRIKELDFTELGEEDDVDILDVGTGIGSGDLTSPPPPPPCLSNLPPPPPLFGCPPPPPIHGMMMPPPPPFLPSMPHANLGSPQLCRGEPPLFQKKKKTIRLFWNEVRPIDWQYNNQKRCRDSLWSKLDPIKLDTAKLENLFETKSKELPVTKKILTMIPSEEETQKIQEAQLANPDTPLGSAEQFLLILSSISELSARLQLWAFKMDYDALEKEVAEPLQDLKEGMDQLEKNKTLRYILSTLLAIGNFLNGTNAKGFELSYLEKVPEVKDTVHKQSLLHHVCSIVVEKFPDSSDLYSEIGAITRSAKVDFDQLQENLCQMERRCKASWDHLKVISKHEIKAALKQRMSDFLKDCAERIIILKIVHRRIINRDVSVHRFSKILSEFALEYRTTRERVLQQKQKRASHRERNKTRGKMITDSEEEDEDESGKFASTPLDGQESQGLGYTEDVAEHEQMTAVLRTSLQGGDSASSVLPGLRTRTRASRGRTALLSAANEDSSNCGNDTADEIMERIVKSATQGPSQRSQPRERKRSRANRKSLRRTLKNGLTVEEAQALGFASGSEMQV
ncbi:FH1/FH2 domain-containing protein 3 [Triplophysa tibetana]|uniref:FH1/FH2 domain-containing protein 3 n=1 Tax=Triplophysa tibetana TaxID=1572043 RepID=A0A5A9N2A2_9TELE|nr:FH1/FH2 domain-containing protein 3 [Triplophysa tibetana]